MKLVLYTGKNILIHFRNKYYFPSKNQCGEIKRCSASWALGSFTEDSLQVSAAKTIRREPECGRESRVYGLLKVSFKNTIVRQYLTFLI